MKTNLITNVTIDLNGNQITKPIAAWIYRERELCDLDRESWLQLTDKGLKAVVDKNQKDPEKQISRVVFNFDAKERDNKINQYREEKVTINSTLEIVNATTELID
jgi:hypothetical protein